MKTGAAAIIIKNKKILLTLRSINCSSYPKHWTMPGGRAELNETPIENVIREILEEVNLNFKPTSIYKIFKWKDYELYRFLGTWNGDIKLQESEATQYKFYTYEETSQLELAFDYKNILESLYKDNLIK
ncbi:MAG: NUDIX hydrolase [Nanoarchaeales archaeon]|nr:NUDIX hydrolase [Nanoarchaeales archaeon]